MAKLVWNATGQRFYETGIKNGVLFVMRDAPTQAVGETGAKYYENGVAWNGLTSVSESPQGGDAESIWADNMKYLTLVGNQSFEGSIECYYYPAEFQKCLGEYDGKVVGESSTTYAIGAGIVYGQQTRKKFALCYRSEIGSDAGVNNYKLHIVYGCYAGAPEKSFETINDSPEASTMSFDYSSDPVTDPMTSYASVGAIVTSCITIDSRYVASGKMAALEAKLYGDSSNDSVLLYPNEIKAIIEQ